MVTSTYRHPAHILLDMIPLPLAEARARLSEIVGRIAETHERFTITSHGKPAAVLISFNDWESLMQKMDDRQEHERG